MTMACLNPSKLRALNTTRGGIEEVIFIGALRCVSITYLAAGKYGTVAFRTRRKVVIRLWFFAGSLIDDSMLERTRTRTVMRNAQSLSVYMVPWANSSWNPS